MPIKIYMPALSPTMQEGTLVSWMKKEGDTVEPGEILCEIETDKATMDVESVDEGVLGKILIKAGTKGVKVNTIIALLLEEGEPVSALSNMDEGTTSLDLKAVSPVASSATSSMPVNDSLFVTHDKQVFASPLARRLAMQNKLDITAISGSGPHGRIIKKDIESALKTNIRSKTSSSSVTHQGSSIIPPLTMDDSILTTMPDFETIHNSSMRQTIAKRLTASARDIPHFNISVDIELDDLLMLRKRLNERDTVDYKLSINDCIVKAAAIALEKVPNVNVAYMNDAILKFNRIDIAIAVAIEDGLITPIIKDTASKDLAVISAEARDLVAKARSGKLQLADYQGGTFTISNMGMLEVKSFNSIINPPQGAILSVGASEQRVVVKGGIPAVATVMSVTLAVDHRCIDGATAASFIKELKNLLEDPLSLIL